VAGFVYIMTELAGGGRYAWTIEDEYCGILLNQEEFIIRRLAKFSDGSAFMEWEDRAGGRIQLERTNDVATREP
jgi:hypothetical protein